MGDNVKILLGFSGRVRAMLFGNYQAAELQRKLTERRASWKQYHDDVNCNLRTIRRELAEESLRRNQELMDDVFGKGGPANK